MIDLPTLQSALAAAARDAPERGIALLDSRGRGSEHRTWAEVERAMRAAAAAWAARGARAGDVVVVALPTSWDWLDAWLGALALGALPVATAPPAGLGAAAAPLRKLATVVERLGARHVAGSETLRAAAASFDDGSEDDRPSVRAVASRITTPAELAAAAVGASATLRRPEADDIAFLQLTSGSTGVPRAVEIRHRSAVHNALAIDEAIGAPDGGPVSRRAEALVSWLPLHHDMGLVGCLLVAALGRLDLRLLRPSTFLARPRLWLEQITRVDGEVFAHAPNFGYQLCVERLAGETSGSSTLDGLDLSRWRWAMTGAEMVRPATARAFVDAFGARGVRAESFRPCYGLAEATLAVTIDDLGRGVRVDDHAEAGEVVGLGRPVRDTRVRIAAPDGRSLPAGAIGEVRVAGPGLFAGYRDDPRATAEALVASPVSDGSNASAELRTGDLGYVDARGELYLTGRLKELLILRGQNVMPHELEWVAESVSGGGGACRAAAFSIDAAEGEEAVLVVEADRSSESAASGALADAVRRAVTGELGIVPADVLVVRRGMLPRTTSGKIRRRELPALYRRGALGPPSSPV